jgi:hypothetical protein
LSAEIPKSGETVKRFFHLTEKVVGSGLDRNRPRPGEGLPAGNQVAGILRSTPAEKIQVSREPAL